MKLSLCIATFNEEDFIHHPLDTAYDFVDEVIIIDGGSEDKTVEIVKKYGKKVKVFSVDNPPMFHINKQRALEKAKGEWILQLDADEALSDGLKNEIKNAIEDDSYNGYWIPRKNYFLGKFLMKGGVYPDYTIRLYRNGKAHFPCKSVHENVEVEGEVGKLKHDLLHYADPDFKRYLNRWNRYTSLDADMIVKNKEDINFVEYFFIKPTKWFFSTYFRHVGFIDGFPGFVFSLFSAIRFWAIYVKVWQLRHSK